MFLSRNSRKDKAVKKMIVDSSSMKTALSNFKELLDSVGINSKLESNTAFNEKKCRS